MIKKYLIAAFITPVLILSAYTDSVSEEIIKWQDCISIAKKNHPDLRSAEEKISQARASVGITRSSLLPQVDASANATSSKSGYGNRLPSGEKTETYSYGVTGKQLLFDSGKTIYDVKSEQKKLESANYNYQVVSATVRQNIRYSFVQLLSAQELLKIENDILQIRKQNFELVGMRYKAGLEHLGSLLTAEANLDQAKYEVSQAARNITLAQRSLAKNMGIETFKPYQAKGELVIPALYGGKPDFELLASSNPQLKSIIQQRISEEYNLKSAKLDYSPRLYGVLSADRTGSQWPPQATEYSAGIQMSLNLFQGGRSWYQTSLSEAAYKQLFADEKSTHNTIIFSLEQAWTNLQNNIDLVNVQQKFLKAAEERATIANAQYSIGTIVFDNWIVIQDALVSAKKTLLNAGTNALLSEADWIQVKGGTLDYAE